MVDKGNLQRRHVEGQDPLLRRHHGLNCGRGPYEGDGIIPHDEDSRAIEAGQNARGNGGEREEVPTQGSGALG